MELYSELFKEFMSSLSEDLPLSVDAAIPVAFLRDGARQMLDSVWAWEPKSVRDEREKAGGTLEELDHEY